MASGVAGGGDVAKEFEVFTVMIRTTRATMSEEELQQRSNAAAASGNSRKILTSSFGWG